MKLRGALMTKKAIVVNSLETYFFAKNHRDVKFDIFSDNYVTKILARDNLVKCLHKNIKFNGLSSELDAIWNFFLNWYRSDNGNDLLAKNGISIGPMLSRRGLMAFVADLKNYNSLSHLVNEYNEIYLPSDSSESLKRVGLSFDLDWYDTGKVRTGYVESTPDRATYYKHPSIHPLSYLARLAQRPFKSFLRNKKVLYFKDWTSVKLANERKDTLIENSFNFFKGCYFNFNEKDYSSSELLFPADIDLKVLNVQRLKNIASDYGLDWDSRVVQLFIDHLNLEYKIFRPYLVRSYAVYKELFSYYKPECVVLAGENEFHNIIVSQLSKKMNIKTVLLIDGYQSTINMFNLFRDKSNKSFIFDKYCAQGTANLDLLLDSGVDRNKCTLVSPPIIEFYNNKSKGVSNNRERVIIMAYLPNLTNPLSQFDHAIKVEVDIIHMLCKMGHFNIGIKVKKGRWSNNQTASLYKELLKDRLNDSNSNFAKNINIEILRGSFYEYVRSASFIIGGISTANIEAHYCGVPFYIYEPFENGQTDLAIASSKIFNLNSVSRGLRHLENNILKRTPSINQDYNYIFSGPKFNTIEL
jgi:hypothetical protein